MARLVVVTPNPAVDVTYRVARQVVGETVRVQEVQRRPGGKGLNVARVLRALGRDALAVQPLGGAAGAWVAAQLAAEGLPAEVVEVAGETRTTVAVVDGAAHPTLYAEPGPVLLAAELERLVDAVARACRPGDQLVVSGSLPPGADERTVAGLVAAGRSAGAAVVVDTSGAALAAACRAGADVVMPNTEEALATTGAPDLATAVAGLLDLGAGQVVVSRGADGLLSVARSGERCEQPAVPAVAGNPTGAGDAATAGFTAALDAGAGTADALRWAAVCGAAAVLQPVAGVVDAAELVELERRLPAPPTGAPRHPLPLPVAAPPPGHRRPRRTPPDTDPQEPSS
ncbi:1-phosphofructokinase family hexose kinase [uncultured Pseudokineococcus sp.]|uniref:1-phosphofructokinase family hexose kinase n=1 Tax=uncultured Pseudokineococcus sp. TaxID=1642928 RepID=UPI00260FA0F9|nr:hexose kinase [uncultured Pseudokineococcus sp.]